MAAPAEFSPRLLQALLDRERLAQVGRLLDGLVHNLSGGIQIMRLPLDLLKLKLDSGDVAGLATKMNAVEEGLERLGEEVAILGAKSRQLADLDPGPLDLANLAAEQLAFWRADMVFKHEVRVTQELPSGLGMVQASYGDLALAFNALVANALEAMATCEDKLLTVRALRQSGQITLEVIDSGPGPDAGMAESVFDPFVTDKGAAHDGLGLFLARGAVAKWGGHLRLEAGAVTRLELSMPLSGI